MCGHSSTERPRQVRLPSLHHYEKCYSRISRESNRREIGMVNPRAVSSAGAPESYRTKMKKVVTVTAASTTMNRAA